MPTNPEQSDHVYMPGAENRLIRYYFYLNAGLNILNQFRNLFLGIFAAYFTLKLTNYYLIPLFFLVAVIALTITGYYVVHRVNKVSEWLNTRFSTHFGIKTFDIQQETLKTLQEINSKLK